MRIAEGWVRAGVHEIVQSTRTLTWLIHTKKLDEVRWKDLLRTYILNFIEVKNGGLLLRQLLEGTHPSAKTEQSKALLVEAASTIFPEDGEAGDEEEAEDSAVDKAQSKARNKARALLDPFSNPASKASGIGVKADDKIRAEILKSPKKIEGYLSPKRVSGKLFVQPSDTIKGMTKEELKAWKEERSKEGAKIQLLPEFRDLPLGKWPKEAQKAFSDLLDREFPTSEGDNALMRRLERENLVGATSVPLYAPSTKTTVDSHSEFAYGTFSQAGSRSAGQVVSRKLQETVNIERARDAETALALVPSMAQEKIRAIEAELYETFLKNSKAKTRRRDFKLNRKCMKGFFSVFCEWMASEDLTPETLKALARDVQSKSDHDFSNMQIFDRLAEEDARFLWWSEGFRDLKGEKKIAKDRKWGFYENTPISKWVDFRRSEEPHRIPRVTDPDLVFHPTWPEYGPNGGSNQLKYKPPIPNDMTRPRGTPFRKLRLGDLSLQVVTQDGSWVMKAFTISWNKRASMFGLRLPKSPVDLGAALAKTAPFEFAGAKLIFDREALEAPVDKEALAKAITLLAQWGPVVPESQEVLRDPENLRRLNEITDLVAKAYPSLEVSLYTTIRSGKSTRDTSKEAKEELETIREFFFGDRKRPALTRTMIGLRGISFDVGVRNAGGAAVFLIAPKGEPTDKLFIDCDEARVILEWSGVLHLPGDKERHPKLEALRKLIIFGRRTLRLQRAIIRATKDPTEGDRALERFQEFLADPEWNAEIKAAVQGNAFEHECRSVGIGFLQAFDALLQADPTNLSHLIRLNEVLCRITHRVVRQRYCVDPRQMGGLSSQRLKTLQSLRNYEIAYAGRTALSEAGVVLPAQKRGLHDLRHVSRLTEALKNLRKDRAQKTIGLYAAMTREVGADFVVIENLKDYRTRADRDKRENRQLANVLFTTVFPGLKNALGANNIYVYQELPFGTSKFDSWGRPGIRGEYLTEEILRARWWVTLCEDTPWLANAKVGDLVPTKGGSLFITLRDGELYVRPAEEIAAFSIGTRPFQWRDNATTGGSSPHMVRAVKEGDLYIIETPQKLRGHAFKTNPNQAKPFRSPDKVQRTKDPDVFCQDRSQEVLPFGWHTKDDFNLKVRSVIECKIRGSWRKESLAAE